MHLPTTLAIAACLGLAMAQQGPQLVWAVESETNSHFITEAAEPVTVHTPQAPAAVVATRSNNDDNDHDQQNDDQHLDDRDEDDGNDDGWWYGEDDADTPWESRDADVVESWALYGTTLPTGLHASASAAVWSARHAVATMGDADKDSKSRAIDEVLYNVWCTAAYSSSSSLSSQVVSAAVSPGEVTTPTLTPWMTRTITITRGLATGTAAAGGRTDGGGDDPLALTSVAVSDGAARETAAPNNGDGGTNRSSNGTTAAISTGSGLDAMIVGGVTALAVAVAFIIVG